MTTKTNQSEGIYTNYTFNLPTPDGSANIFISENEDGSIYRVDMSIGKTGASVAAWCNALSRMVTFALSGGISIHKVVDELKDMATDRVMFVDGIFIRSGPEALAIALDRYRIIKKL